MAPQFAKVRFSDSVGVSHKKLYTKPVSDIKIRYEKNGKYYKKSFKPTDNNDFIKDQYYRVLWRCDSDCQEEHNHEQYFPGQILYLAGN